MISDIKLNVRSFYCPDCGYYDHDQWEMKEFHSHEHENIFHCKCGCMCMMVGLSGETFNCSYNLTAKTWERYIKQLNYHIITKHLK